jgi:EAL domain-containing protein (putative c-di-GMP-specific phosphodiesterase class I)
MRDGSVTPLFQPIVEVGSSTPQRVVAVEALSRGPRDTAFENPVALFAAARRIGIVAQLDQLCIETALQSARRLPKGLVVFLNVHPATLCGDCGFPAFIAGAAERHGILPSRLALEVLEHARVDGSACGQLLASLDVLRDMGVRLAVDDVGATPDDLCRALSLRPEYLKVEGTVVRGARTDRTMRALLHTIAERAAGAGARVVAEGIEEADDLEVAADAGITLAQGYLLGRPVVADVVNRLTT